MGGPGPTESFRGRICLMALTAPGMYCWTKATSWRQVKWAIVRSLWISSWCMNHDVTLAVWTMKISPALPCDRDVSRPLMHDYSRRCGSRAPCGPWTSFTSITRINRAAKPESNHGEADQPGDETSSRESPEG
eukprot:1288275-Heterocapsa_arctica.AAC.1